MPAACQREGLPAEGAEKPFQERGTEGSFGAGKLNRSVGFHG